jgi:hypothetical protein
MMTQKYCGLLLLICLGLGWFSPPALAHAQDACAGLVATRLVSGGAARVAFDDGVGVVLRSRPSTTDPTSEIIENLAEGAIFTAIGPGPDCQEGRLWWFSRLPDGREGYLPEGANATGGYYVEPYEVGADIVFQDPADPYQLKHYFVTTRGEAQARTGYRLTPQNGTVGSLWQEPEIALAEAAFADRQANCPDQLGPLVTLRAIRDYTFDDQKLIQVYPNREGSAALIVRDFLVNIPTCAGQAEDYGTSYISVVDANGERLILPFSQHSDPPASQFCQPQAGLQLQRPSLLKEVVWSQDGRYAALGVRYLRNSPNFPCAFYHAFIADRQSLNVAYAGEGRRLGWGQGGRRLRYFRLERSDPNQGGQERLWSVLPDGSDPIEVFLPRGATWLPGAMDLVAFTLPWSEQGERVLACNGLVYSCGETLTMQIVDSSFAGTAFIAPENALLGSSLWGVYYVLGDTALLWVTTTGFFYTQPLQGERAGIWSEEGYITEEATMVAITVMPTGAGVIIQQTDGWTYLNLVDGGWLPLMLP